MEGECWDREGWTSNYDRKYAVKCLPKIQISEAVEIENKYKMILQGYGVSNCSFIGLA